MNILRDYQNNSIQDLRLKLRANRSVILQLPTGAGKTAIVSEISRSITNNNKRVWFIVPRKELVNQSKKSFQKWGISFGVIDAKNRESRAYKAHIISLQTLIRRLDKIKQYPDVVVFDEAHLNFDAQKRIIKTLPDNTKIIGVTATPGRADGLGLGALYDDIIYGASIPYLTACGFLAPLRYYAPPTEGIKKLKFRSTGELDNNELDNLLTERKIYGRAVEYYKKLARNADGTYRRGVGFCAGVRAAEKQAAEFRAQGFIAESIDGKMPDKKQRALLDGLASGKIQVLCSADLLLYGWDSPAVSYGFLLRRTKSKALYFQIVGRILRPCAGKPDAVFVDHTATVDLHTEKSAPGVPPFYLDNVSWNFHGKDDTDKGSRQPPPECRLCPYDNYAVCMKPIRCTECEKYDPAEEKIIESIPLQERIAAMAPQVITPAEKQAMQDAVIEHTRAAAGAADDESYDNAVKALCEIAEKLEYSIMWVYWRLTSEKYMVNNRALHSIARAMNYKSGWVWHKQKQLRETLEASA